MNSKKKVARWVVPFAVVIFVFGLGVSHAYDTSQLPLAIALSKTDTPMLR